MSNRSRCKQRADLFGVILLVIAGAVITMFVFLYWRIASGRLDLDRNTPLPNRWSSQRQARAEPLGQTEAGRFARARFLRYPRSGRWRARVPFRAGDAGSCGRVRRGAVTRGTCYRFAGAADTGCACLARRSLMSPGFLETSQAQAPKPPFLASPTVRRGCQVETRDAGFAAIGGRRPPLRLPTRVCHPMPC
jgi:hypothetical protein